MCVMDSWFGIDSDMGKIVIHGWHIFDSFRRNEKKTRSAFVLVMRNVSISGATHKIGTILYFKCVKNSLGSNRSFGSEASRN